MRSFLIEELNARLRYHDIPGELPARIYLHGLGSASSFVFPEIAGSSAPGGRSDSGSVIGPLASDIA